MIDDIIPEPLGGAHYDRDYFKTVQQYITNSYSVERVINNRLNAQRMDKYSKMGEYKE
jgi:acetyl-CoA carboxylase carboxyl transferase subunit alpha